MSDTTTNGIRVQVTPKFLPERSSTRDGEYVFAYFIRISNDGAETAGTDEVEYLFISLGPYDKFDPDEFPPPLGRWDDPTTWVEGYPQVHRRTLLQHDPRCDGSAPSAVTSG